MGAKLYIGGANNTKTQIKKLYIGGGGNNKTQIKKLYVGNGGNSKTLIYSSSTISELTVSTSGVRKINVPVNGNSGEWFYFDISDYLPRGTSIVIVIKNDAVIDGINASLAWVSLYKRSDTNNALASGSYEVYAQGGAGTAYQISHMLTAQEKKFAIKLAGEAHTSGSYNVMLESICAYYDGEELEIFLKKEG